MSEPPASVARRLVVSGRVQGVFFRSSCQERARDLGLAGWVRNTSDGTVEAWVEGDPSQIGDLIAWCREGPGHADVEQVQVYDETLTGVGGFRVR